MIVSLCAFTGVKAQEHKSFDDFRKDVLGGYQDFRKGVLDDYAKYLDGVWREYDAFRGVERDPKPKPNDQPAAPTSPDPEPVVIPQPQPQPTPQPRPEDKPQPIPQPRPQPQPEDKPQPRPVIIDPVALPMIAVGYKDINVRLPKIKPVSVARVNSQSLAAAWRETLATDNVETALKAFDSEVARMRLPDWWTINLAVSYGHAINPTDRNAAMILAAVIMVNRGLDIKVSHGDNGVVLLYRSDDMIYARPYFQIDGKKYYIVGDEDPASVYTFSTPNGADGLHSINWRITQTPDLPQSLKRFAVTNGKITITGEVDGAMIERLRDYPQMDIPLYAESVLQPRLRESVRRQLKEQTAGMTLWEAANALISLVQHGFDYATDDVQFGFEKPFFMEELLYWPKCDCEDRSVFYSWIAREVLGVDVHLLHYPGHEATAIALGSEGRGSGYDYEGKHYYIADPTFIGASVGMCMPDFINTKPEIQLIK